MRNGQVYKDAIEKERRYQILRVNIEYIKFVNKASDQKYRLGINQFVEQTNGEHKASCNAYKPKIIWASSFKYKIVMAMPTSMDHQSSKPMW